MLKNEAMTRAGDHVRLTGQFGDHTMTAFTAADAQSAVANKMDWAGELSVDHFAGDGSLMLNLRRILPAGTPVGAPNKI